MYSLGFRFCTYICMYIYIYMEGYGRLCRVLKDVIVIQKPGWRTSRDYEEVNKVSNLGTAPTQ